MRIVRLRSLSNDPPHFSSLSVGSHGSRVKRGKPNPTRKIIWKDILLFIRGLRIEGNLAHDAEMFTTPLTTAAYLSHFGHTHSRFHNPTVVVAPTGYRGPRINILPNGTSFNDIIIGSVFATVGWDKPMIMPLDLLDMGINTADANSTWICGRKGILPGEFDSPVAGVIHRMWVRMSVCRRLNLDHCKRGLGAFVLGTVQLNDERQKQGRKPKVR